METSIAVFRSKEIRKTIHNNEWWFSVADVVEVLTDSIDPRQYIKKCDNVIRN
jgi:prophage antirepressor-like protein